MSALGRSIRQKRWKDITKIVRRLTRATINRTETTKVTLDPNFWDLTLYSKGEGGQVKIVKGSEGSWVISYVVADQTGSVTCEDAEDVENQLKRLAYAAGRSTIPPKRDLLHKQFVFRGGDWAVDAK